MGFLLFLSTFFEREKGKEHEARWVGKWGRLWEKLGEGMDLIKYIVWKKLNNSVCSLRTLQRRPIMVFSSPSSTSQKE